MGASLDELNTRLDELSLDIEFIRLAAELRPRLGPVLSYADRRPELKLAITFKDAPFDGVERVYSAMLLRVIAAFEKFVRDSVNERISEYSRTTKNFNDLPDRLKQKHVVLTGKVLGKMETPTDHLKYDYDDLIKNLATAVKDSTEFNLNSRVFADVVTGATPENVEKALHNLKTKEQRWQDICRHKGLQAFLGTAKVLATETKAVSLLASICNQRNQIAHGGDMEPVISFEELRQSIEFIRILGLAIEAEIDSY